MTYTRWNRKKKHCLWKPSKQEQKSLGGEGNSYVNLFETLREENSILYMYPPALVVNDERKPRIMCVPDSLHEKAFRICHANPVSGHLSIYKTSEMLAGNFYWPNLYFFAKSKYDWLKNSTKIIKALFFFLYLNIIFYLQVTILFGKRKHI